MDKQEIKKIKDELKAEQNEKQFSKLLNSEFDFVQDVAKIALGKALPPITKERILSTKDVDVLIYDWYLKIIESIPVDKSEKKLFSNKLTEVINNLSTYQQVIYHSYDFENVMETGDVDIAIRDFLLIPTEKNKLVKAYQSLESEEILQFLNNEDWSNEEEVARMYEELDKNKMKSDKLIFIQKNHKEFVMK
ncbi:hypothetical protein [Chondrinema litorale]|uniref:hypothetical protein n=1 Tax=Chondrinema litorale TaxID=2994555 RepID=UPI00254391DA|nr:hypothetical protein [Chondrinema litorale]UZR96118.1 hypothetical protein OQ292_09895 [Chondrinema litorale]